MIDRNLEQSGRKFRVISYLLDFLSEELVRESEPLRRSEIERQIQMFRFLPRREFSAEDYVVPSALVSLKLEGRIADYLIVPSLGGWVTSFEGRPLQVITPNSPLGEVLMGRKLNDQVVIEAGGKTRRYEIIALH